MRVREVAIEALDASGTGTGGISSSAGPAEGVADRMALERAFDRLDADARTILVLHHLDGRGLSEVASMLGIPVGTAKSRLFVARRALERALERER
jgi:RNA polymerase sigma-70 factor (ECF subfamily)